MIQVQGFATPGVSGCLRSVLRRAVQLGAKLKPGFGASALWDLVAWGSHFSCGFSESCVSFCIIGAD